MKFLQQLSFIIILVCASLAAYAQQPAQQQTQVIIPPQRVVPHAAQRYEVDAKRTGTNMNSDDALPRSREFLRIDSTYYVGWMYEGAYKYNHAADFVGYKNATEPLERALGLLERDYHKELSTRTSDLLTFFPAYKYDIDYTMTAFLLTQCYLNIEMPDKVFALQRRVRRWNLQRDLYMDIYNYMAWVVHRNRFYTHEKYSFLRNSIEENERLANSYLDTGLRRIEINRQLNAHIFPPGYEADEKFSVYHYKSILYSYALNMDSGAHYYELLRNSRIFPHNNYATFCLISGNFREAEKEYRLAASQDAADKRLQEWAYYSSILDIYKGFPKVGELQMKDMILAAGSTPGFGWYNIALARCLFYDGQIAESKRHADKAAEFKELHIGTTLGQSHYDFSIQLSKLMTKEAEWQMKRFEHRNWWYNPAVLGNMAQLMTERYLQQFLIINQFAANPERDRVIYKLFSTESTVAWDEVWYLIHDFSTQFFLKRFEQEAATDPRPAVRKYFRLFAARMHIKEGDYKQAQDILNGIIRDPALDGPYEMLFTARTFQAMAECAEGRGALRDQNEWLYRMYITYPQLVPFTGMTPTMQLTVQGAADEAVVSRLKDCNIIWSHGEVPAPHAYLTFSRKGDAKLVEYYVTDMGGNMIVPRQSFSYNNIDVAGISMAYRLFGVGGLAGTAKDADSDAL